MQGEDLSSILVDESEIAFSHFENLRMDSSDPLEDESQMVTAGAIVEEPHNSDGSPSDHDRGRGSSGTKNNKSDGFLPNLVHSANSNNNNNNNNRRKNKTPQRSHLS